MKRTKVFLFIGFFLFVFGGVFLMVGIHSLNLDARFAKEGVKTTGTVKAKRIEERWDSKEKRNDTYYYLTYAFTPSGGSEITYETSTGRTNYDNYSSGQTVEIEYLPADPQKSRIAGNNDKVAGYVFSGVGLFIILLGGAFLFFDIKARIRMRHLLQNGAIANAQVTGVEQSNMSINNVRQWQLRYSYKDQMGRPFEGTSETMSPQLAEQWKEGDTGQIRYDKTKPDSSLWLGKRI